MVAPSTGDQGRAIGARPKDRSYDLRYRPATKPPEQYTDPGQHPILLKGAQDGTRYGKWIKAFKEETV